MPIRSIFAVNGKTNGDLTFEESVAANFIQIKRRVKNNEKLTKFTEIFWPYIFIQGNPSYHVMIDDTGMSSFDIRINNAPRIAQVGHVLRDQKLEYIEKITLSKKIIEFQERINIDSEKSPISNEEFVSVNIKGLVSPELLEGFSKIISKPFIFKTNEFSILESLYTFDNAIDIAQNWMNNLNEVIGNKLRWKTLKTVVSEPIEKWITDFVVKEKDLQEIFRAELNKADEIDEEFIQTQINHTKDNLEHWVLKEQKDIISKIGKMFMGINLIFEDLIKRNNYFLQIDSLKTKMVGEVVMQAFQHISHIRDAIQNSEENLQEISIKMNKIRQNIENLNTSAKDKISQTSDNLLDQKELQELNIQQISSEYGSKLNEIQIMKDNIISLYEEINTIIENKIKGCLEDEIEIRKWEIFDDLSKIHNPTVRIYIPIGIGIIEDEDEDERIEIIFPSIYHGKNLSRTALSQGFLDFEKVISKKLDRDMKLRSNFEYTIENSANFEKEIEKGLAMLKQKGLLE